MSEIDSLGKWLIKLFQTGYKKLGSLGIANVMIIIAFCLYLAFESIGNTFERLVIILSGRFLEWWGKKPQPVEDNTPVLVYAFILLGGLGICLFVLKKHYEKKLWPKNN